MPNIYDCIEKHWMMDGDSTGLEPKPTSFSNLWVNNMGSSHLEITHDISKEYLCGRTFHG